MKEWREMNVTWLFLFCCLLSSLVKIFKSVMKIICSFSSFVVWNLFFSTLQQVPSPTCECGKIMNILSTGLEKFLNMFSPKSPYIRLSDTKSTVSTTSSKEHSSKSHLFDEFGTSESPEKVSSTSLSVYPPPYEIAALSPPDSKTDPQLDSQPRSPEKQKTSNMYIYLLFIFNFFAYQMCLQSTHNIDRRQENLLSNTTNS